MANFEFNTSRNEYFNYDSPKYQNEKDLMSVIINEYYNKYGVCMEYYIVSYNDNYDRIFGEDNDRRYIRNFEVMAFYLLPKEEKMWSKFGIEGLNEITIYVSKRHFTQVSQDDKGVSYIRPQIGDIIKSDFDNYFYEVTEVAEDTGMFFQSKQHIWEINIKPMKDEFINTTSETSGSDISKVVNIPDIFDIRDDVDIEKDEHLYNPKDGEKPNEDPFGNW